MPYQAENQNPLRQVIRPFRAEIDARKVTGFDSVVSQHFCKSGPSSKYINRAQRHYHCRMISYAKTVNDDKTRRVQYLIHHHLTLKRERTRLSDNTPL